MTDASSTEERLDRDARVRTAELFATLLLHEVDARLIRSLDASGALAVLSEMGLRFPAPDDAAGIEQLACDYFEAIVKPMKGAPPVQSLHEGDTFDGEAARSMKQIAEAAGVRLDPDGARGAPIDHLGCQLALWAHLETRDPIAAEILAARHLRWALPALERARGKSFYGTVLGHCAEFLATLPASAGDAPS